MGSLGLSLQILEWVREKLIEDLFSKIVNFSRKTKGTFVKWYIESKGYEMSADCSVFSISKQRSFSTIWWRISIPWLKVCIFRFHFQIDMNILAMIGNDTIYSKQLSLFPIEFLSRFCSWWKVWLRTLSQLNTAQCAVWYHHLIAQWAQKLNLNVVQTWIKRALTTYSLF